MEYLERHPFVRQTVEDKVLGVMIGSALGDSIGLYTGISSRFLLENYLVHTSRRISIKGGIRGSLPREEILFARASNRMAE